MAVDVASAALTTLAQEAAKTTYKFFLSALPSGGSTTASLIEGALARHLKYASSWASQYNFLGLSAPKDARYETIPLRLTNTPRRYRGQSTKESEEVEETKFLTNPEPIVLLGDPGAGKTTTLKRICSRLLYDSPEAGELDFQLPIVVVLRELGGHGSVIPYLAHTFSLAIEATVSQEGAATQFSIFGFDAAEKIAELLDSLSSVLIVDGLDELPIDQRNTVSRELRLLVAYCNVTKIIASCRSGDYNRPIDGFHVYEILPLSRAEVESIASSWLADPHDFLQHLDQKPYRDVADRPLLLSFLIFLFNNEGHLPPRPSLIYRKVVYRLLKDWDDERGIKRGSAYANFDTDIKIDFLSEFSYLLTYNLKSRGFTEEDALNILADIGGSYGNYILYKTRQRAYIGLHREAIRCETLPIPSFTTPTRPASISKACIGRTVQFVRIAASVSVLPG